MLLPVLGVIFMGPFMQHLDVTHMLIQCTTYSHITKHLISIMQHQTHHSSLIELIYYIYNRSFSTYRINHVPDNRPCHPHSLRPRQRQHRNLIRRRLRLLINLQALHHKRWPTIRLLRQDGFRRGSKNNVPRCKPLIILFPFVFPISQS